MAELLVFECAAAAIRNESCGFAESISKSFLQQCGQDMCLRKIGQEDPNPGQHIFYRYQMHHA